MLGFVTVVCEWGWLGWRRAKRASHEELFQKQKDDGVGISKQIFESVLTN